ncbi:hypothetical protein [Olsenella sp. An290]|nr:hypothetical protein [Olsenella sp. An290]
MKNAAAHIAMTMAMVVMEMPKPGHSDVLRAQRACAETGRLH